MNKRYLADEFGISVKFCTTTNPDDNCCEIHVVDSDQGVFHGNSKICEGLVVDPTHPPFVEVKSTTANEFNMGSVTIHDDENLYDAVFNGLYINTTGSRQMQRIIEQ